MRQKRRFLRLRLLALNKLIGVQMETHVASSEPDMCVGTEAYCDYI